MIRALVRGPLAGVTRTRRGLIPMAGWSALAVALATVSRTTGHAGGAGHVLRGPFGGAILPLLAYGVVGAALGGAGLRRAVRGPVALGAEPARAACASALVAILSSALVGGLLAGLVCVIAHGPGDPPLASDLPATVGVALVGAAAYGAWFSAGAALGRRGGLRAVFLVLDWLLGVPGGFGALFVPRGHLTSLLGGPACFDLPRRASSVLLVGLVFAYLALTVRLGRRVR